MCVCSYVCALGVIRHLRFPQSRSGVLVWDQPLAELQSSGLHPDILNETEDNGNRQKQFILLTVYSDVPVVCHGHRLPKQTNKCTESLIFVWL